MNPEVKQKWLTALRSAEYTQCKNVLHDIKPVEDKYETVGYCCLGVLTDIYIKVHNSQWDVAKIPSLNDDVTKYHSFYGGKDDLLPINVSKWSGFEVDKNVMDPSIPVDAVKNNSRFEEYITKPSKHVLRGNISLSKLNDIGFSFNEIADLIEKYL